jgi:integrase
MKSAAIVIYRGKETTAGALARRKNLSLSTFSYRVETLRWPIEKAADTPPDKRFRKGGRRKAGAVRPCPELCEHPDGRAYCRWREGSRRPARYFGQWGTAEARTAYERFRLEWVSQSGAPTSGRNVLNVARLVLQFKAWATGYYVKDGRPTSEVSNLKIACTAVLDLYGALPVDDFRPAHLLAVRQRFIDRDISRRGCNRYTAKIARMFAWGVGADIVHPDTAARLKAVPPLVPGRTKAPDLPPVAAADPGDVEKTLPHLHPDPARRRVLDGMIRLQLVTGMRPGELCALIPEHVDRSVLPWRYDVGNANKSRHRGKARVVWIGPRGRDLLGPFLDATPAGRLVFGWPFRGSGNTERWTGVRRVDLARFVRKACHAAGVAPWHPNRIRHTHATEIHDRYGSDEAVAAALGNTPEVARQVYVDSPGERVARQIAEAMG